MRTNLWLASSSMVVVFVMLTSGSAQFGGFDVTERRDSGSTPENVLFGPSWLENEQVFLQITNNADSDAAFRVTYTDVNLDEDKRYGFVHSFIDPDLRWSGQCPMVPLDPAIAEPGTPIFWGIAISPGFTCAYLPQSELIAGVGAAGEERSPPTLPLGEWVALGSYEGHELVFEVPPGENHFLTGPLWFGAEVTVTVDRGHESTLTAELVQSHGELFRLRLTEYDGDWSEPVVKAWAANVGSKWMRTDEQIRHPYNIFFLSTSSFGTHHNQAEFPDGSTCSRGPMDTGIISARHITSGMLRLETIFAKAWGLYPPSTSFFIYDLPIEHDRDPSVTPFCNEETSSQIGLLDPAGF